MVNFTNLFSFFFSFSLLRAYVLINYDIRSVNDELCTNQIRSSHFEFLYVSFLEAQYRQVRYKKCKILKFFEGFQQLRVVKKFKYLTFFYIRFAYTHIALGPHQRAYPHSVGIFIISEAFLITLIAKII